MIQENIINIKKTLPENVRLIAVTKTYPRSCIDEALKCGQMDFGENKVQELLEKYRENENIRWHFIGHLQTNKVKMIIDKVHLIHSVDSLRLLEVIQKEASKKKRIVHILLQVNIAQEKTKFGFQEEEIETVMNQNYPNIQIDGIMVIGPHTENIEDIKKVFARAKQLKDHYHFQELSMGMSFDYQLALDYETTMIRIGTDIFGKRNVKK